jgi:predicted nucleic acid-binding protein
MILTPDNEYCVVLDACVLMPMPLCDTLLRAAEEPSFFRIAWSEQILNEVRRGLAGPKFGYSAQQVGRRIATMQSAFPEAFFEIPPGMIEGVAGIPDPDDRHVVALAIHAHANTIVTNNIVHFPETALSPHHLTAQTADEFLVHQYHLVEPQIMLDKLDRQAAGIRKQRSDVLQLLANSVPRFCGLCSKRELQS